MDSSRVFPSSQTPRIRNLSGLGIEIPSPTSTSSSSSSSAFHNHPNYAQSSQKHEYDQHQQHRSQNLSQSSAAGNRPKSMIELSALQAVTNHHVDHQEQNDNNNHSNNSPRKKRPPSNLGIRRPKSYHAHALFNHDSNQFDQSNLIQSFPDDIENSPTLQKSISTSSATNNRSSKKLNNNNNNTNTNISRQGTLISMGGPVTNRNFELERILSNPKETPAKILKQNASHPNNGKTTNNTLTMEQCKGSKARVEVDLTLDSALVVEGGIIKGKINMTVRDKKDDVWITSPRVRIAGFEEVSTDLRHIFYHHVDTIDSLHDLQTETVLPLPCYAPDYDAEGFHKALPGQHVIPFHTRIPINRGAKGPHKSKHGTVRYIIIGSVKIRSTEGKDRAIAHFYRHIDVYPYFNPAIALASSPEPIVRSCEKSLFMGGNGKVWLNAKLHRSTWVSGQHCYVDLSVANHSNKKVKTLSFSIIRCVVIYRPRLDTDSEAPEQEADMNTCQTSTIKKKISEDTVEVGKRATKGGGVITAKGMWMGVDPGQRASFSHSLVIPSDALSISRGRHLEVNYLVKVSVNAAFSSDISVELPIKVINFISIDPPPAHSAVQALTPKIAQIAYEYQKRGENDPLAHRQSWNLDVLRGKFNQKHSPDHTNLHNQQKLSPTNNNISSMINKDNNQHYPSISQHRSTTVFRHDQIPTNEDDEKEHMPPLLDNNQASNDCVSSPESLSGEITPSLTEESPSVSGDGHANIQHQKNQAYQYMYNDFYQHQQQQHMQLEYGADYDDDGEDDQWDLGLESEEELDLIARYTNNTDDEDGGRVTPQVQSAFQKEAQSNSNSRPSSPRKIAQSPKPRARSMSQPSSVLSKKPSVSSLYQAQPPPEPQPQPRPAVSKKASAPNLYQVQKDYQRSKTPTGNNSNSPSTVFSVGPKSPVKARVTVESNRAHSRTVSSTHIDSLHNAKVHNYQSNEHRFMSRSPSPSKLAQTRANSNANSAATNTPPPTRVHRPRVVSTPLGSQAATPENSTSPTRPQSRVLPSPKLGVPRPLPEIPKTKSLHAGTNNRHSKAPQYNSYSNNGRNSPSPASTSPSQFSDVPNEQSSTRQDQKSTPTRSGSTIIRERLPLVNEHRKSAELSRTNNNVNNDGVVNNKVSKKHHRVISNTNTNTVSPYQRRAVSNNHGGAQPNSKVTPTGAPIRFPQLLSEQKRQNDLSLSPRSEASTDDFPAINNILERQRSSSSFKAPLLKNKN